MQNIMNSIVKNKVNVKNNFFLNVLWIWPQIFEGIVYSNSTILSSFSLIIISLMLSPFDTEGDILKSISATFSNLMKVNEIRCATELQNDKNTSKIILMCTPYEVKWFKLAKLIINQSVFLSAVSFNWNIMDYKKEM